MTRAEFDALAAQHAALTERHRHLVAMTVDLAGALQAVAARPANMADVAGHDRGHGRRRGSISEQVRELLANEPDMSVEELQSVTGGSVRHIRRVVAESTEVVELARTRQADRDRPIGFRADD